MVVNPFWFGGLMTIVSEIRLLILVVVITNVRENERRRREEERGSKGQ